MLRNTRSLVIISVSGDLSYRLFSTKESFGEEIPETNGNWINIV